MKGYRQRLLGLALAGLLGLASLLPAARAEAVDAWTVAAQALGVLAAYQSSLRSILALGNNVDAQLAGRRQDLAKQGQDANRLDVRVVDSVMRRLVERGNYALRANSLPFLWSVNDSPQFNAACYPTNYISVNRGLVRGLNCEEDELAAVLAHEMAHGLAQHSARNYAKAVAQFLGMSFLNMDANLMDWNKMTALAGYSIAKNVTLPTEYEADEEGFHIMASAGFNPGGAPAAMARMSHYFRYETPDLLEYDAQDRRDGEEDFSDHPETERREHRLAELLSEYGCRHVSVQEGKDVYLDGWHAYAAAATREDYDNRPENAYYFAGGLAKAFHDHDGIEGWGFRLRPDGREDFLTEEPCYRVLRETAQRLNLVPRLREHVALAYGREAATGARQRQRAAEAERLRKLEAIRAEALAAGEKQVQKLLENGDRYSDYGMGDYALAEMARAFAAGSGDTAEAYGIRGRAKAVCGDLEGAVRDANRAVAMDPSGAVNYLNRADVLHMAGEMELALADTARALELAPKSAAAFQMQGDLEDELGLAEQATESYRACYRLTRNPKSIPQEYLERIDPRAAKRLERERERVRQEKETEENE